MKRYTSIPMVPGPVSLHPAVLEAISADYPSGQVDEAFLELYAATGRLAHPFFGTTPDTHDIVFMSGEGMLALWSALKSCLRAGDKVVTVGTGIFGDGFTDMAVSLGCSVENVSLPYDTTIGQNDSLQKIEEAVRRIKPKMITAVHCETPSGTLNPIHALGEIKKRHNVPLLCIDAVASAGGAPVHAAEWHCDLLLVGSQKCLSAPPSMSILAVSPKAWEVIGQVGYEGYDALAPFFTVFDDHRCPYTPNWHGLAAVHAGFTVLTKEGQENVFARHEYVAQQCRNGLNALEVALFPDLAAVQSPTVTAALVPLSFSFAEWKAELKKHGLAITGSFGPMDGKVFRLGHMGTQADAGLMTEALAVIKTVIASRS